MLVRAESRQSAALGALTCESGPSGLSQDDNRVHCRRITDRQEVGTGADHATERAAHVPIQHTAWAGLNLSHVLEYKSSVNHRSTSQGRRDARTTSQGTTEAAPSLAGHARGNGRHVPEPDLADREQQVQTVSHGRHRRRSSPRVIARLPDRSSRRRPTLNTGGSGKSKAEQEAARVRSRAQGRRIRVRGRLPRNQCT